MIIDFHTHVFPDKIAQFAIDKLEKDAGYIYKPVNDGTVCGLLDNMDAWGIDISVIQPVVTKQSHVQSTNKWASAIQSDRLVCFGSIYPHTDDYERDIDYVAGLGLRGLKFHAEYQNFILDDEHMIKIYNYALSIGLILLHHAGYDPAFEPPFKSSPRRFVNVAEKTRDGVIIAAHFGGHDQWDDVETCLAGSSIYFDTSMGFEYFSHDRFISLVRKHGTHKILFGSDAPWSNAQTEIEHLKSLPLSDDEKCAILGGNAERILGINSDSR